MDGFAPTFLSVEVRMASIDAYSDGNSFPNTWRAAFHTSFTI
jgi:hypothetical protein